MNRERMTELADIIERSVLYDERDGRYIEFDMKHFVFNEGYCGTSACIAGYAVIAAYGVAKAEDMAIFDEDEVGVRPGIATEAQRILGLSREERLRLFSPPGYSLISKDQAVRCLRHAAKTGKIDWKAAGHIL